MDILQTIESHIGVPLIAPEAIHEIDAKEIARTLCRLEDDAAEARDEVADAWGESLDESNVERLQEVKELLREAIDTCESCNDDEPCQRCRGFKQWLSEG